MSDNLISDLYGHIDRLTRELAEAKARAVIPDGWVAVPEMPIPEYRRYLIREDLEYGKSVGYAMGWNACRAAMLSARPESPPYGLPSKESDQQKPEVSYE